MKNLGLQLYRKIIGVFPLAISLQPDEGNLIQFSRDLEAHLNVVDQGSTASTILLNFYRGSTEEGCYEVRLDHVQKIATSETIRAATEQTLYSRIAQVERAPVKIRSLLSRAGQGDINQALFNHLQNLIPNLETASAGKTAPYQGKPKRGTDGVDICILQNDSNAAMLEVSPININGITQMTIAIDKNKHTAGVVEISGSFGRYPAYLPYPDGKEMTPQEREGYSQMLLEYMGKEGRKPSCIVSRG